MKVNTQRVRSLNAVVGKVATGPVVYVMTREQRVHDNWALLYAQEKAQELGVSLEVLFVIGPMFLHGTARHNNWMITSLQDVEGELHKLQIPFSVQHGEWGKVLPEFVAKYNVSALVFDFNPLQPVRQWRDTVAKKLTIPVYEVDARNIIPCWHASDKQEYAAYTFRPKVHKLLPEFLEDFSALRKQVSSKNVPKPDWEALAHVRSWDIQAPIPNWIVPGEKAALKILQDFIEHRLSGYAHKRNDPNQAGVSHLSPYLRWGNISSQRVALEIKKQRGISGDDKEAFLEELIVRRELSDNFVFYNPAYAKVSGAHAWAQKTIAEHAKDKRDYVYTYEQFKTATTHDDLWNAAQLQMIQEGKMHGYMRMYWAKKILEWTPDVQTAIDYALKLNDTYELDGRDSNGVTGVMWSICGVHDRAWNERAIFGKIRYMNDKGCTRKFDTKAYIAKYLPEQTLFHD